MFRPAITIFLAGLALTAGCEAGSYMAAPVPPPPPPLPVTVTIGPDNATIAVGASLRYQAVSTSTVAGWEWSLSDVTHGSISSDGVLLALAPGTLKVRACASNAPAICGAADAIVIGVPASGGAPGVTLTPAEDTVSVGQTVEFLVAAVNFATPGWTWAALDNATATIDANGLLTARRAGFTVVVACATAQPAVCGSSVVHVR